MTTSLLNSCSPRSDSLISYFRTPKLRFIENPLLIDFRSLRDDDLRGDCALRILDSIARVGSFQLVEFGIPFELLLEAVDAAVGVFEVSNLGRAAVTRSADWFLGFDDVHGDEEESESAAEEFMWCNDKGLNSDLERVWPKGYSNFSEKMIGLNSKVEEVAEKVLCSIGELPQIAIQR